MGTWYNQTTAAGQGFIQPGFEAMGSNTVTSGTSSKSESYLNSIFGQLELSYRSIVDWTLTRRNDWFSALSYKGKNSSNHIFYPSVGAGFNISEAFNMPEWIPYLKIRGSWAQSGGAVGPYNLGLTYANSSNHIFYPSVGAGFIISEAFNMPEWIPYLKIRGSWAQSGGAVGPYKLGLTYAFNQKMFGHPIGYIGQSIVPNLDLKPLTSNA